MNVRLILLILRIGALVIVLLKIIHCPCPVAWRPRLNVMRIRLFCLIRCRRLMMIVVHLILVRICVVMRLLMVRPSLILSLMCVSVGPRRVLPRRVILRRLCPSIRCVVRVPLRIFLSRLPIIVRLLVLILIIPRVTRRILCAPLLVRRGRVICHRRVVFPRELLLRLSVAL